MIPDKPKSLYELSMRGMVNGPEPKISIASGLRWQNVKAKSGVFRRCRYPLGCVILRFGTNCDQKASHETTGR